MTFNHNSEVVQTLWVIAFAAVLLVGCLVAMLRPQPEPKSEGEVLAEVQRKVLGDETPTAPGHPCRLYGANFTDAQCSALRHAEKKDRWGGREKCEICGAGGFRV